jgi:hypothetical protein
MVLPSSQASPAAALVVLSPQTGNVQFASQPAVAEPVSHCSGGVLTTLLPQIEPVQVVSALAGVAQVNPGEPVSKVQVLEQPSPLIVLPSSQASGVPAVLRMPSPHVRGVQSTSQVAVGSVAASQASPALTTPFPHAEPVQTLKPFAGPVQLNAGASTRHVLEQPSPLNVLPSSQVSVDAGLRLPSPQTLVVQLLLHVAEGSVVASHCSVGEPTERTRPSPHVAIWQKPVGSGLTQPSVSSVLPSSQASPVLRVLLPQIPPVQVVNALAGVAQVNPGVVPTSSVQVELQPSPLMVLPSSQASGVAVFRMPSPQTRSVQSTSQVAVGSVAASQASPALTTPFPHAEPVQTLKPFAGPVQLNAGASTRHVLEQPSPLNVLPSSQVSVDAGLRLPSPQTLVVQLLLHVAEGSVVASHCSVGEPTERTRPSPHTAIWQKPLGSGFTQPSVSSVLPSSQASPVLRVLLPQMPPVQVVSALAGVAQVNPGVVPTSSVQVELQPSPLTVLPSSQASGVAVFRMPSPQTRSVQSTSQVAVGSVAASQASPALTTPFPHAEPVQTLKPFAGPVQLNAGASTRHVLEQPSPLNVLPSSQVSVDAGLRLPSPQALIVQLLLHVGVGRVAASQASLAKELKTPSPQAGKVQSISQPAVLRGEFAGVPAGPVPPSHCSGAFTTALPQAEPVNVQALKPFAGPVQVKPDSITQALEQPSPLFVLPSSQVSAEAALNTPSPHTRAVQSTSQVAVGKEPIGAGSHPSPGFNTPLPQFAPEQELGEPSTVVQVKPDSTTQISEQPSPLIALPSSQASVRALLRFPS